MKFALCVVVLTIMVSMEVVPTPGIELPSSDPDYFEEKLKSVQGAIKDTIRAGQDLETMEKKLQNIVNLSSHFYRTESATEYATDSNAYANGWKGSAGSDCSDDKDCVDEYDNNNGKFENIKGCFTQPEGKGSISIHCGIVGKGR